MRGIGDQKQGRRRAGSKCAQLRLLRLYCHAHIADDTVYAPPAPPPAAVASAAPASCTISQTRTHTHKYAHIHKPPPPTHTPTHKTHTRINIHTLQFKLTRTQVHTHIDTHGDGSRRNWGQPGFGVGDDGSLTVLLEKRRRPPKIYLPPNLATRHPHTCEILTVL